MDRHCFEFFFEHLNLIEILAGSPASLERSCGILPGGGLYRMSIRRVSRIGYGVHSSPNLDDWTPAAEEPIPDGNLWHLEIPLAALRIFHRWSLFFDYAERTSDDYVTF